MASLTATTDPATGTIRVDVEQTIARDTFTRVLANTWGSPDVGPPYLHIGALTQYSVSGSVGVVTPDSVNNGRGAVLDTGSTDHDLVVEIITNTIPTGGTTNYGGAVRYMDASNYMRGSALIATGTGAITAELMARVGGVDTVIASVATGLTIAVDHRVRIRACGNRFMLRISPISAPEPEAWTLDVQFPGLSVGTFAGAIFRRNTGNATPTFAGFDNLVITTADGPPSGDDLRLYRVTPDGVETEVRGSPFSTEPATAFANMATAVFWDGEAPFDTDVFYRMYSACGTLALTSNTVNLASGGDGWLRDPTDPSRNLRIVMEEFFDECVDEDVIVFSGLEAREYPTASGIFDRIQAARPATVSMIRKNYGSTLLLTSFSLDDIDSLEDIFADGRILSLSLPMEYGWAHRSFGTDYITIFDITQSVIGVDQRVTTRFWTIPFRLSPEPVDTSEGGTGGNGIGGGDATYDALAASVIGTTYNSLTASGFTYLQIAQGTGY